MTAGSTQRPERLTRNNALLLLVDHQVGLYTGIRDIDVLQLKHNVVGLTRAMLALKVPVIVTTTTEKMWGPLIPELAEVLPGVPGIERTTVNAWDEKRFVDAVKATGRKNLIVTGISTDVCLAFPAIAALADGFQSYAVIDAWVASLKLRSIWEFCACSTPVSFRCAIPTLRLKSWPTMQRPTPRRCTARSACRSAAWFLVSGNIFASLVEVGEALEWCVSVVSCDMRR
jgi:isochorismate hydrolase